MTTNDKQTPSGYVLLSGGIDSTTAFALAVQRLGQRNVRAVSINYGQRHAIELEYAKRVANFYGRPHEVISLPVIPKNTMLTGGTQEIPSVSYDDLPHGISPTYVPFRNGLMLSTLAAFIQGHLMESEENQKQLEKMEQDPPAGHPDNLLRDIDAGRDAIIFFGAHAEDAANWAYPDCTPEFTGAMANAIFVGSYQRIRLETPLQYLHKDEIVTWGSKLGAPYHLTWSCYVGGEKHCGICPTCRSRRQGFIKAGIEDPTVYRE